MKFIFINIPYSFSLFLKNNLDDYFSTFDEKNKIKKIINKKKMISDYVLNISSPGLPYLQVQIFRFGVVSDVRWGKNK